MPHVQSVCTRPLLGGEGPCDEANLTVDQTSHTCIKLPENSSYNFIHTVQPFVE